MLERSFPFWIPTQHSCQVADSIVAVKLGHTGQRLVAVRPFQDQQVVIGQCGDLWQVSDDKDLVVLSDQP